MTSPAPPEVTVRPATEADIANASAVMQEAAKWLWARGIHQWRPEWFGLDWAAEHVANGSLHVAEVDRQIVGTLRLLWADPEVWGRRAADAGYVHAFAVARSHAGIGASLLDWATRTAIAGDRDFLRLDCWEGNARLRRYYEDLGFQHRGDMPQSGRGTSWVISRYERPTRI